MRHTLRQRLARLARQHPAPETTGKEFAKWLTTLTNDQLRELEQLATDAMHTTNWRACTAWCHALGFDLEVRQ
jgi:adenylosuccinate lyase